MPPRSTPLRSALLASVFLSPSGSSFGQYSNAESVVYDAVGDRYFVGNTGCQLIRSRDQAGAVTTFVDVEYSPYGLEILNGVLYACVRHKRTYLLGYFFRDTPHLFEHREAITRHLRPAECHRQDVQDFMTAFRDKKCTLVGVHIRSGHYKGYLGGRYYYENATYARWMGQIQDSVPGPVQFLVASTDPIDDNDFEGLPIIKAPGNIVGDMFTLAECDLIMGPPSSFSGWASFQRLTPLVHLRERDHDVRPELFAPLNLETAP